jgi:hypothetical protein
MKKNRGDEPIGVIMHIFMEMSQGNSLCSYMYLKQTKLSCFSFHLFFFFLYKIREQEGRTGGAWHQWKRGVIGERVYVRG